MQLYGVSGLILLISFVSAEWTSDGKQKEHHHEHLEHIKSIVVTKKVPKPVPVEIEKHVPYEVKVPVDKPYPVYVPKPYPIYVDKKVPYEVQVPVPKPYIVEKKVPYEVRVPVDKPYPVEVPKPYDVYVEKKVPYIVEKKVPYKVQVPVEKKYPVPYTVEKQVPYPVVKEVPYKVEVPVEKPVPFQVEKPVPYHVQKEIPYPVYKEIPYPVRIPYRVEVPYTIDGDKAGNNEGGNQGKMADSWQQLKDNSARFGTSQLTKHSYSTKHNEGAYSSQFVRFGSLSKNEGNQLHGSPGQDYLLFSSPKEMRDGEYFTTSGYEELGQYKTGERDGWKQQPGSDYSTGAYNNDEEQLKSYHQDSGSATHQYPQESGSSSPYTSKASGEYANQEISKTGSSKGESAREESATSSHSVQW